MGIGGISIWQLLIILVIVFMLFGTKKLRNLGGDLGGAIKGFKKAMSDDTGEKLEDKSQADKADKVIEGQAEKVSTSNDHSTADRKQ